jgi:hypothetical protein
MSPVPFLISMLMLLKRGNYLLKMYGFIIKEKNKIK